MIKLGMLSLLLWRMILISFFFILLILEKILLTVSLMISGCMLLLVMVKVLFDEFCLYVNIVFIKNKEFFNKGCILYFMILKKYVKLVCIYCICCNI